MWNDVAFTLFMGLIVVLGIGWIIAVRHGSKAAFAAIGALGTALFGAFAAFVGNLF